MARGDGLRVQMAAIEGVTQGRTRDLLTPHFRFQCPPLDSFTHDHGHSFQRTTNYQGRESIRRGGRRLVSVPIRTIVVEYASWVTEKRWDLEDMVEAFEKISEEGWSFRLLATHKYGGRAEIDMVAVLESCNVTENANEPDARYLDLQFTQSDDPGVTRKANRRSGSAKPYPFTITLRKDGTWTTDKPKTHFKPPGGDLTLAAIAQGAWGMPSQALYLGSVQNPPIKDWGPNTKLINHARFKKGGKIVVPEPPLRTEHGAVVPRPQLPSTILTGARGIAKA
jgi:hypothetical protein